MSSVKDLLRGDVVDGSGTANYVSKWSDADTITNSVIYDDGSNVGIGTSSPASILHLSNTSGAPIYLQDSNATSTFSITELSNNAGNFGIQTRASDGSFVSTDYQIVKASPTENYQRWFTSGTERMRITSGGFLKASNDSTYNGITGGYHEMRGNGADTLVVTSTYNTSGQALMICKMGANTNNTSSYFYVGETGGINKIFIYGNGNIVNANNSYGPLSDIKLKENITDASPKLEKLMNVHIVNYNLIGDELNQIGVIAQELEQVFPALVSEHPDTEEIEVTDEEGNVTTERVETGETTKSVKMSVFVPILIKAMQEQQEIINNLKARIETLENK